MPKDEFLGYKLAPHWRRLTVYHFDAKTHARVAVSECVPLKTLDKTQREQTLRHRMKEFGLPLPPPCFEPK